LNGVFWDVVIFEDREGENAKRIASLKKGQVGQILLAIKERGNNTAAVVWHGVGKHEQLSSPSIYQLDGANNPLYLPKSST